MNPASRRHGAGTPAGNGSPGGRLSFDEYLALPAINWSTLKEMRRSPRHYRHRLEEEREDTTRLAFGRAVHTAVLEPDRFAIDYAVFLGERRAGKEWAAFCEANPDRTILKKDEYETCLAVRDAVRSHPVAAAYLTVGRPEHTIRWVDEDTGLACKGRLDWLGALALVDLKTTTDADAQRFGATAARMGYHLQLAFYGKGLRANGFDLPAKIIAAEVAAPHDVAVFAVDAVDLAAAEDEVCELLRRVAECHERGEWPGKYAVETPLRLPAWAFNTSDDEGDLGITINGEAA